MSDTDTTKTEPEQDKQEASETGEFTAITSQEQLDRILASRLARERSKYTDYEELKKKAALFDEQEEASKTELQKAQEALASSNAERDQAKTELLRHQIVVAKGLNLKAAAFLKGTNREELEDEIPPLARGKLCGSFRDFTASGNTPAGAGKTTPPGGRPGHHWKYPR